MKTLLTLTAATMMTLLTAQAQAGSADDALNGSVEQYRSLQARSEWHNPYMPNGTGLYAAAQPSGDEHLQTLVAGYDRQLLDRGGWVNPYVSDSHYAVGAPLLAVRIGDGVTSRQVALERPLTSPELALLVR